MSTYDIRESKSDASTDADLDAPIAIATEHVANGPRGDVLPWPTFDAAAASAQDSLAHAIRSALDDEEAEER